MEHTILPRVIRLRDAPFYVGVDINRFNKLFRPKLSEIRYGKQSIGFDRLQLDAIIDDYVGRDERPKDKGDLSWDAKKLRASTNAKTYGGSTNKPTESEFNALAGQLTSKKQKSS